MQYNMARGGGMKRLFLISVFVSALFSFNLQASNLIFQAGYDIRLRNEFYCGYLYTLSGDRINNGVEITNHPSGLFYAGLTFNDFGARLSPLLWAEVVNTTQNAGSNKLGLNHQYLMPYNYSEIYYKNSSQEKTFFKLARVSIGGGIWPKWSESRYFIGLDIFNSKDFYDIDGYRNSLFGYYLDTTWFEDAIHLEMAYSPCEYQANLFIVKINAQIENFIFSALGGIYKSNYSSFYSYDTTIYYTGMGLVYKTTNSRFYIESLFAQRSGWDPLLSPVAGVSMAIPGVISLTAEINYDYYFGIFLETIYNQPFGWSGWDATLTGKYNPDKLYNNTALLLGLKNTTGILQFEARYGYESAGNHRIDINLRLLQDFEHNFSQNSYTQTE